MVTSRGLQEVCQLYLRSIAQTAQRSDVRSLMTFICELVKVVTDFKERAMYDTLSLNFIKLNIFPSLIKIILATELEEVDYGKVAKVFELCACHPEGISII